MWYLEKKNLFKKIYCTVGKKCHETNNIVYYIKQLVYFVYFIL
jgi:hypothetical protein